MRKYQRSWVAKRRNEWIAANGPCALCGSWDRPEVDHIDPTQKKMEPARVWGLSLAKRLEELAKCQVLCHKCHAKKSALERHQFGRYDNMRVKAPDGMAWCYADKHFVVIGGFSKDSSKFDGRQDECRACRSTRRSKKFARDADTAGRIGL